MQSYCTLAVRMNDMKKFTLLVALIVGAISLNAQNNPKDFTTRSVLDPNLAPFYHGVASGDPLQDRVILWTRITLDPPPDSVQISWKMATDTGMANVINSGSIWTNLAKDYTVKVDAGGLQPNRWYYYQFQYQSQKSIVGRTRTLPTGDTDSLRFVIGSCADYQNGYYNAYRHISERNDIDAVVFLGDYIYEYAASSSLGRNHEPPNEMITLTDYRIRHSQYKLDPDLRAVHQQYPFISVWDDHETCNDAYKDGAQNHDPNTEGDFQVRKANSTLAYSEWMPIRLPDPNNTEKIFRKFTWGALADMYFLDTRLYDRSVQVGYLTPTTDATRNDTSRYMIGPEQLQWLKDGMTGSTAEWQIVAQQIMVAPLLLNILGASFVINGDQWDGYPADRQRLMDMIMNNNINDVVVLTGDIHSSWANDIPYNDTYDPNTGANSVGVEFVGTSITSENLLNLPVANTVVQSINPHIKYIDLAEHGYYVLDVNKTRTQGDWYYVSDINTNQNVTTTCAQSYYVNQGERFLRQGSGCVTQTRVFPPLAPHPANNTSIDTKEDNLIVFNAYPNPFLEQVVVQFFCKISEDVRLVVRDMNGKTVYQSYLGKMPQGLNYAHFNGSSLSKGQYRLEIIGKDRSVGATLIKIE